MSYWFFSTITMNYKKIIFLLCLSASSGSLFAQGYADDLLRYSTTTFGGTARTQGIAGAQTALGGDIGSLASNPAGLGFFRKSDFSVTPTVSSARVKSSFLGNQYSNSKSSFDFTNLGVVWARSTPQADEGSKTTGWLSYAFGLGYNRTSDFSSNISFAGKNTKNSFTYFLADQANTNGINFDNNNQALDNTIGGQAYNGYLINAVKNGTKSTYYPTANPTVAKPVNQMGMNNQAGSTNDVNLSFGTNYGNQLYLGVGANFTTLRNSYAFSFQETGIVDQANSKVNGLAYNENFDASGSGFSAKAGLIYRPDPAVRFGIYAQTPTWYHITEATNSAQVSGLDGNGTAVYSPAGPVNNAYAYDMKTPWRYNFGSSFFLKTYGFISADVELVDYKSASFHSGDASDMNVNSYVQKNYRSAVNYRLGAEARLGLFSIRGGYSLYGNPYSSNTPLNAQATSFTGGLGYRSGNVYVDAAVVNTQYNSTYTAYPVVNGGGPVAGLNTNHTDVMVTIGTHF